MIDVAIIGGGASGLAAAVSAARTNKNVSIIEKNEIPGKKILVTGGGRCNFTNLSLTPKDYYEGDYDFISTVLTLFSSEDALNFMFENGIAPVIRNGYAYPLSEDASSVRDSLLNKAVSLGVKIHNNSKVLSVKKAGGIFLIETEGYTYEAAKVILACGGCASPSTGSNGEGYEFARKLGHHVTDLYPALSGICFESILCKAAGTRVNARLTLNLNNNTYSEQGEIQINDYGISGVPVMSLSRYVSKYTGLDMSLSIDFLPEFSKDEASVLLDSCQTNGLLPRKLQTVLDNNKTDIKNFVVKPTGVKGFENAHVTCGGVCTAEINPLTMESRLCGGLYLAGEIIDIDGRCGGYNLHFAWASGAIAGQSAAKGSYIKNEISDTKMRIFKDSEIGNRRS